MVEPREDQIEALRVAFDTFTRRYKLVDAQNLPKTLNEVDSQTLLYVRDHAGCGPTDIARCLGVATTTISSATDRLVKRGLLERHRIEDNRRAVALRLTVQGEDHVAATVLAHLELYRMMLGRLSVSERDTFISLITKIVHSDN